MDPVLAQDYVTVETMTWIVGGMGMAILGLAGFSVYLLKELLKAKDEETEAVREVLPLVEETTKILPRLCELNETLIHRIGSLNGGPK